MPFPFHATLKLHGNINRIDDMNRLGYSAREIAECFARENINLKVVQGDVPLLANMDELGRKGLSRRCVSTFCRETLPATA